jgi:hypothetical protein
MESWKPEILFLAAAAVGAALIITFTFLAETGEENLQRRLDAWREALPEDVRADFDAGRYNECSAEIEERLKTDPDFAERYEAVREEELAVTFAPADMVDYFRKYFKEKLAEPGKNGINDRAD